jgi:hypothetical protein
VGVLDKLGRWLAGADAPSPVTPTGGSSGIRSPWVTGQLSHVVWRDLLGTDLQPVTRAEAMGIPAIARGRHLLTNDASRCPLEVWEGDTHLEDAGAWLQRTNLPTSPQHRIVWTVDDLIHYGWSLWIVRRSGPGPLDPIEDAARCPFEWWQFGDDGTVLVNSEPVPAAQAILIPGYHEGILNSSARTIRAARELETQWAHRAANPIPAVELHQTTDDQLTDDEIRDLVADWKTATTDSGGAVAYTPRSIEVRAHGTAAHDLLVQGRNAAAIDAARALGVPAAMVDASNVNSTLTYETLSGRNLQYVDQSLSLYLGPIEARLSLDDVTPAGTRVRANTAALTTTFLPTGAPTKD